MAGGDQHSAIHLYAIRCILFTWFDAKQIIFMKLLAIRQRVRDYQSFVAQLGDPTFQMKQ